jgi:heme A synthase
LKGYEALSEQTTIQSTRNTKTDVHRVGLHQLIGLAVQFLLGMAENLIGQPSETKGAAQVASNTFLGLHILLAIALLVNAAMILRAARNGSRQQRRLARWGGILITLTIAAGVITTITGSDWWSYAMATGFITSLGLYGALVVQSTSPTQEENSGAQS